MAVTGFTCSSCGAFHADLGRAIPVTMPTALARIAQGERGARAWVTPDNCIIDGLRHFRYGSLELPIHGHGEPFIWGVWVELNRDDHARGEALRNVVGRESEPPYHGILGTDIPFYAQTSEGLPVLLREQPVGTRPFVFPAAEGHLLWSEQRDGIAVPRVQEIMEWSLHGRFK